MATRLSDLELAPRVTDVEDVPVDKLLVLKFQNGHRDAYSEIFERYRPLTERICLRILGNREDAQEAVQETMMRVLRGLETFNGRYQLQAWIARIATNVSVDMVRARARRPNAGVGLHDLDEHADAALDPEELVTRILDQERVRSVLEGLPDHHREALVLREFEGRSHEEIGDAMGVSSAQAKALIHRAKGTFRRAWTDGDHRGIAAIVPILLAPFKLPGLRRLVEPARDAVANASSTATQVAVNVTAAPVAAQTAMSAADRVTAVALTVIVAGSATVGAVAIRHTTKPAAKPSPTVAVAPAPSTAPPIAIVPPKSKPVAPHPKVKHHTRVVPVSAPTSVPSTAPSTPPSTDPSGSPSPGGSPVPPPPAPAPDWSASFHSSVDVGTPQLSLVDSNVTGGPGSDLTFAQTIQGDTVDRAGKPFGFMNIEFNGEALQGVDSYLGLWIWIDTPDGRYAYQATGGLTGATQASDGSTTYSFSATYVRTDAPQALDPTPRPMPNQGTATLTLTFWADGTLYASGLSLLETPAT